MMRIPYKREIRITQHEYEMLSKWQRFKLFFAAACLFSTVVKVSNR